MAEESERWLVEGAGARFLPGMDDPARDGNSFVFVYETWPLAFRLRVGHSVFLRVSPTTGCYDFEDADGTVFWTIVPSAPLKWDWISPFLFPLGSNTQDLYSPFRLVREWRLTTPELEETASHFSLQPTLIRTAASVPVTNLCFTAFSITNDVLFFTADWPTNCVLPNEILDLYGTSNFLSRSWIHLSSHPATNKPASFSVPMTALPWHGSLAPHTHDETCGVSTNIVLSPLNGTTTYTNIVYECGGTNFLNESAFFRLGSRVDSDGDGLPDAYECYVTLTDPANADSDWDGLSDGDECALGSNPLLRDTDCDGFVDGIDPAPLVYTDSTDANENGVPDAFELFWFGALDASLDPTARDMTGFTLATKMAAGLCPTNAPFASVVPTNGVEALQLVPCFGIEGATNGVLWEKTIPIDRHGAWEQYFVSSDPNPSRDQSEGIGGWVLDGLRLDWADSTGASGSVTASSDYAPLHLPVSTNVPTWIRLRLVATRDTLATCPQPLYFLTYTPVFSLPTLRSVEQDSTQLAAALVDDSFVFQIDRSTRPTWESFLPGEQEAMPFDIPATATIERNASNPDAGLLSFAQPAVFEIPQIEPTAPTVSVSVTPQQATPSSGRSLLAVLDPDLTFGVPHAWGGSRGITWDWDSCSSVRTSSYPLDSEWLWRSFRCDGTGFFVCDCAPELSLGNDEAELWRSWFSMNITTTGDTAEATIGLDGETVWAGTATHEWYDWGALDEPLEDTCGCGGADELEGPTHASLGFRIPLGIPRAGQVSGFLWFHTDAPLAISSDAFQLLTRTDAVVSDGTTNDIRTISCSDVRGRTLALSPVENGVRIAVLNTASGTLEHTWDIVNENGSASRIRLTETSRLGNTLSDALFVHDGTDWHRIDPIANTLETLRTENLLDDSWEPRLVEERVLADATDTNLVYSHTLTTSRRFGDRLRETERIEDAGTPFEKRSCASYWEDGGRRAGQPRLVAGDARAWSWADYDTLGRPVLRFEQLNGSPCPSDSTDYSLQNPPWNAAATAIVSDYAPLAGDSNDTNDLSAVRTQSRYRLEDGTPTLVARTWNVYARTQTNGWPALVVRTERAASQGATFGAPNNAVSISVSIDPDAPGVPLLLRGRPLAVTDENGVTTLYDYALGSWNEAALSFTPGGAATSSAIRIRAIETTPEAPAGIPLVSTVSETVEDATHGNEVWSATRVLLADGSLSDPFEWEARVYDDKDRLRSTLYADGSSATNAYSCCRLLFTVDRTGLRRERLADTGTDHLRHAWLDVSFPSLPQNEWRSHEYHYAEPGAYDYQHTFAFRAVESRFDPIGRETLRRTFATEPNRSQSISELRPASYAWNTAETNLYPHGTSDHRVFINARGLRTVSETLHDGTASETTESEYDGTNLLVRTVSRSVFGGGSETRREWDGNWTSTASASSVGPDGCLIELSVSEASDAPAVTNSVTISDFLGRTIRATAPLSDTTYAYDGASTRVLSATDSRSGRVSEPLYDALRHPIGSVSAGVASLSTVRYELDPSNVLWRVTEEREAAGAQTNLLSTLRERLTGLSDALCAETQAISADGTASVTTVSFDPTTLVRTETNLVTGLAPFVTKSQFGRTTETQARDGTVRKHFFDPYGQPYLMGETPPGGSFVWRSWTYRNALGDTLADVEVTARNLESIGLATNHVSSLYNPGSVVWSGFVTEHEYDIRGKRIGSWDPEGNETLFDRDSVGRLMSEYGATYPAFQGLDTAGRLDFLGTTRDGQEWDITEWNYDLSTGLCTNKIYADGSSVARTYDAAGRPLRTTLASGRWTQNAYDANGRLASEVRSDDASVQYGYDDFGRLVSSIENNGREESFARDLLGRVTNETQSVPGSSASLLRTYDAAGRSAGYRLRADGNFAQSVCYHYGMDGQMNAITITNAQGRTVSMDYDWTLGRLSSATIRNATGTNVFRRSVQYASRRPSLAVAVTNASATVRSFAYVYDGMGRPAIRNTDSFAYNARGEVVSAIIGTNAAAYVYDDIGNRTTSSDLLGERSYVANELNQYTNLTSRLPPLALLPSYDADGNLVSCGEWTYEWDAAGRLATATNAITKLSFAYDRKGRRTRRMEYQREGSDWNLIEARTFVYDDWNLIHETRTASGVETDIDFFWGPDLSGSLQGAGGVGGLVAVSINGSFYFPGYDNNGNVIGYWDETGDLVTEYAYDAFGNTIHSTGALSDLFPHRFSTKYFDTVTSLYYYGYRYYSPNLGRWLNRDPIEEQGGLNLYGFCKNKALDSFDLLGRNRYITQFDFLNLGGSGGTQLHVGVAVDDWICQNGKWKKIGVVTFDFKPEPTFINALKAMWKAKGMIKESQGLNLSAPITIKSTPQQDIKMLDMIRKEKSSPPFYSALFHNCIFWSVGALFYGM